MTEFRFLFVLSKAKVINGQLNVVADAIEKMPSKEQQSVIDNAPKKEINQDKIWQKKMTQQIRKVGSKKIKKSVALQHINISSDDDDTISQIMKKAKCNSQNKDV